MCIRDRYSSVANVHLSAVEHKHRIVFLHLVKPGPANRSYGLQVAALAGIPQPVLTEAHAILASLEANGSRQTTSASVGQLGLFPLTSRQHSKDQNTRPRVPTRLETAVGQLALDDMTPREALEMLYRLRALADPENPEIDTPNSNPKSR